ncbi:MAG: cell division protein ZapA [Calditrichaeota bacterium]|nr:MAG: cell division protein ZapA [Calditrichota bacterium]
MDQNRDAKHSIQVQIFGADYSLKSEKDPEYVRLIARYVDEKITQLAKNTNVKSQTKIAVLVALNIADELFQLKQRFEHSLKALEKVELTSKELCQSVDHHLSRYAEAEE